MFKLKELRQTTKMTQAQLAKELGVSQNTLSYWESSKVEPDISTLIKLSEIFNVSIDYLLGLTDNKKPLQNKTLKEAIQSSDELSDESKIDLQKMAELLKLRDRDKLAESTSEFYTKPVEG